MKKLTMPEMGRLGVEAYRKAEKLPLVVVLDNVRSLHNIGSVFRTCDAFRVSHICLCGISQPPPSPEIHKTALGAEDSVEWRYYEDTMQCVADLRSAGVCVLAIEQCHGSVMLDQEDIIKDGVTYAVILGNEVHGVAQEVVDAADGCLEIPQYGTKHSLNVSVTAGIVIWEMYKALGNMGVNK